MDRRSFLFATGAVALAPHVALAGDDPYGGIVEAILALSPETATSYGLDTGARSGLRGRLDDRTTAHRFNYYDAVMAAGPRLASRRPTGPRDAMFQSVALWLAECMNGFRRFDYGGIGGYSYPVPYAVSQLSGAYQALPDFLATQHVIESRADCDAYLDRLAAFAGRVDDETGRLRADAAKGVAPPDFLVERTLSQMASFQKAQTGPQAEMVTSLARRAADKGIAGDWAARAQALVDGPLAAAIARQYAAVESLRVGARSAAGVWALPQGGDYYAGCLKFHTTTDLTPEAAHALGLEQVAAISAQARAVLDAHGVRQGTVAQGIKALGEDPAQRFANTEAGRAELLAFIEQRTRAMYAMLPEAFSRLPKTPLEVRRVPPAIELGSPGAYSQSGSIDGSRPGGIYFNLKDTADWPKWRLPTTVYHEGVPGHHLQGALANEASDIPELFKILGFNAYNEGWALYAEQLADELGAYADAPLGRLGMLQASLFRACRIVVDTGMHAKQWSREQAIAYLIDTAGETPNAARREIERYCAWPGQACGYKIGHLEIVRLREQAKARLGPKFDLKGFHEAVLGYGSVPLASVAKAVDLWVAQVGGA